MKRAVVVGGGFIGLEMVENLVHMGIHVTLVEMLPQVNQGVGCTSHLKGTAGGGPGPCMLLHSPHSPPDPNQSLVHHALPEGRLPRRRCSKPLHLAPFPPMRR